MKLLVLGGTRFLSQAVAADALARGHDGHLRGARGVRPGPRGGGARRAGPRGTRLAAARGTVVGRRRRRGPRRPSLGRRRAGPPWPTGSRTGPSCPRSACTPTTPAPGGTPGDAPAAGAHQPTTASRTPPRRTAAARSPASRLVQARADEPLVVRPGLIIGPGDPSGRFTYWPERLAEGGEVLAPESPDRDTQAIDVRDLAAWIVDAAPSSGVRACYDATGPVARLGELVDEVRRGGRRRRARWSGRRRTSCASATSPTGPAPARCRCGCPRSVRGLTSHDVGAAFAAGLPPARSARPPPTPSPGSARPRPTSRAPA